MRKLILAGAAALSVAAVFAASSIGDEGATRSAALDRDYERVPVHRVAAPSASGSAIADAAKKKGRPKVSYLESAPLPIPAEGDAFSVQCPKKHKALTGYFLTSGGITIDGSAIDATSKRAWTMGLFSPSGAAGEAIVGVVCGKKL